MWFAKLKIENVVPATDVMQQRKRAKILVIDDDENALPFQLLRDEGYNIEYWETVRDLRRLEEADFDIVFLDIQGVAEHLGQQDGLGVLKSIKRSNPHQIVVAFSGHSFDLSKMAFWKEADDGLKKPVDFLTAKETIDRMLERLTVNHFWAAIRGLLKSNNVKSKQIDQIEHKIAKAIKTGNRPDYTSLFSQMVQNKEVQETLLTLGSRLLRFVVVGG